MIQAAKHITEVLGITEVAAEISDRSFWELAEEGTAYPFVNFSINDEGPVTKSGIHQYTTEVRVFAKSLTESSRIGKVIQDAVKASEYKWKNRGARSSYNGSEAKEAYIELNFEFKL